MTYEEKIEEAADNYVDIDLQGKPIDEEHVHTGFKKGIQWARENCPLEFVLRSDVEKLIANIELLFEAYNNEESIKTPMLSLFGALSTFNEKYIKGGKE